MADFPYTPTNKVHAAFKAQFLATTGDAGDGGGDIGKLREELAAREKEIRILEGRIASGDPEIGKLREELAAREEEIRGLKATIDARDEEIRDLKATIEAGGDVQVVEELAASIIAFYAKSLGPHGGLSTRSPEATWLRRVMGERTGIRDIVNWAQDMGSLEERTEAFIEKMKDARPTQPPPQDMSDDELRRFFVMAPEVSKYFEDARNGDDDGDDHA